MSVAVVRGARGEVPGSAASAAVRVAHEVACRLREPETVYAAATLASRQTAYPATGQWLGYGVARGDAGLAVMCAYMDACFPGEGWDVVGHRFLEAAAAALRRTPASTVSLFSGLSGFAFAAHCLSRGGARYQRLLPTLDRELLARVEGLVQLGVGERGLPFSTFDVISGLAGLGAYLLCRVHVPEIRSAVANIVSCLTELAVCSSSIPGWYTPAALLPEYWRDSFPAGNLNCGLAHGIPGPLALMALAHSVGVVPSGSPAAIERVADWLSENRTEDEWGVTWPAAVSVRASEPPAETRNAWCYGSPGVARALWLAGQALEREDYRQLAVEAMEAVYRRPVAARGVDSPTFCHGLAGLLQVTLRFAFETGRPELITGAQALTDQLLSLYEPDSLLGFRDRERSDVLTDQPGLLDGAAGVALVLAATSGVEPFWDRLFLLA